MAAMAGQRDSAAEHGRRRRAAVGGLPSAARHFRRDDGPRRPRARAIGSRSWPCLRRSGREEVNRRFAAADRHLRDSGVFYRVYEDPAGAERPWPLSHVPLLIDAGGMAGARGRAGRSAPSCSRRCWPTPTGPATLVREGRLPAAVIAGNPEFLRPLVGVAPPGGAHLRFYAVDVGRSPDGHWWVLGDRTQAPSGAGYALENRLALSRAMPDIYRELKVERLAPFFQAFQAELSALNRQDDSRVCVLTPGPMNETYFEHAYLARYLGFLLVEGEDLTVRDDGVFIRTVSGLKRAEVLLRRLDADFADPLELNARSRLGVPGLVQAVRDGTVVIANALGSGVVEARALLSFLPALAPAVLGTRSRAAQCRDLVARPAERARDEIDRPARRDGDRVGVSGELPGRRRTPARSSAPRSSPTSARASSQADRASRRRLRRAGGGDAVDHAGLAQRPARAAAVHAAAVPGARSATAGRSCPAASCASPTTPMRAPSACSTAAAPPMPGCCRTGRSRETTLLPTPDRIAITRATGALPSRAAANLFWLGALCGARRSDAAAGARAGQPRQRQRRGHDASAVDAHLLRCSAAWERGPGRHAQHARPVLVARRGAAARATSPARCPLSSAPRSRRRR